MYGPVSLTPQRFFPASSFAYATPSLLTTADSVMMPSITTPQSPTRLHATHARSHPSQKNASMTGVPHLQELAKASAYLLGGFLLRLLPDRHIVEAKLPTDWKILAKALSGVMAVKHLNRAFGWMPAPWLLGAETVALLHPLTSRTGLRQGGKQLLFLIPYVAALVQGTSELNKRLAPRLEQTQNIPPWLTSLAVSFGSSLLGIWGLARLAKNPTMKKLGLLAGVGAMTCARGCTPGGVICVSEMMEVGSASLSWLKSHLGQTPSLKPRERTV